MQRLNSQQYTNVGHKYIYNLVFLRNKLLVVWMGLEYIYIWVATNSWTDVDLEMTPNILQQWERGMQNGLVNLSNPLLVSTFSLLGHADDILCNSMMPSRSITGKKEQLLLLHNKSQHCVCQIVPWCLLVLFVPRLSICWLWGPWHTRPVSSSSGSCTLEETSSVVNLDQKQPAMYKTWLLLYALSHGWIYANGFGKAVFQCSVQDKIPFHSPVRPGWPSEKDCPLAGACRFLLEQWKNWQGCGVLHPPQLITHDAPSAHSPNLNLSNWQTPFHKCHATPASQIQIIQLCTMPLC